jgi:hypothetical protein
MTSHFRERGKSAVAWSCEAAKTDNLRSCEIRRENVRSPRCNRQPQIATPAEGGYIVGKNRFFSSPFGRYQEKSINATP